MVNLPDPDEPAIVLSDLSDQELGGLLAHSSGRVYKMLRAELARRRRALEDDELAASPVVGVLLMLVIVVALAAVVFAGVRAYAVPEPPVWASDAGHDDTAPPAGEGGSGDDSASTPPTREEAWSVEDMTGRAGWECTYERLGLRDYLCVRVA